MYVNDGSVRLVSRYGHYYTRFDALAPLAREIGYILQGQEAILDGELVCLDDEGKSQFYDLLRNRATPCLAVFDLLSLDGNDFRQLSLMERKAALRELLPVEPGALLYVDHFERRGIALYNEVCRLDLEGIVAKYKHPPYGMEGKHSSWVKIRNPTYSQMAGAASTARKQSAL